MDSAGTRPTLRIQNDRCLPGQENQGFRDFGTALDCVHALDTAIVPWTGGRIMPATISQPQQADRWLSMMVFGLFWSAFARVEVRAWQLAAAPRKPAVALHAAPAGGRRRRQ